MLDIRHIYVLFTYSTSNNQSDLITSTFRISIFHSLCSNCSRIEKKYAVTLQGNHSLIRKEAGKVAKSEKEVERTQNIKLIFTVMK
jgi:hypothetical protein